MDGVSIARHSFADYTRDYNHITTIAAPAHYISSHGDYITAFYQFLHKWVSETTFESNLDTITSHGAYRAIVAMGPRAVPLIVDELKIKPSLLVYAMEDITGERPYAPNMQGNIRAMSDHWVLWAEREDDFIAA
jgi:hypothetical protein